MFMLMGVRRRGAAPRASAKSVYSCMVLTRGRLRDDKARCLQCQLYLARLNVRACCCQGLQGFAQAWPCSESALQLQMMSPAGQPCG